MLTRRSFLGTAAAGFVGVKGFPFFDKACSNITKFGWVPDKTASHKYIKSHAQPYFSQRSAQNVRQSGKGRVVLLHKYLERALGGVIIPHYQGAPDCVGQGYGIAVDTLTSTQIFGRGLAERFVAKASTEFIYAGSRYEIGFEQYNNRRLLRFGGSFGLYAAEFLHQYGVLVRQKYGDIDLSVYSSRIAKDWGKYGVPDELEPLAKLHPIRSYTLVRNYSEARDALANGYPVIICSDVGFNPDCHRCNPARGRDSMGFLNPCGLWMHCMCLLAVDDTKRPGCLCLNSWGPNWVTGPKRLDQPDGSFWIDAHVIDRMCSKGDSFAISNYIGFPRQILDYVLF